MHTSTVLQSDHFRYFQVRPDANAKYQIDYDRFFPDYHELDRVGVVCRLLEDGVLHAGYALLALTTAFYDCLRARGGEFFDYPQHFAIIDVNDQGVASRAGRQSMDAMGPWGGLDVWPDNKYIPAVGTASGMLKRVFDHQINRLFWPHGFAPGPDETQLPGYARKMLANRLKSVYYYNAADPDLEISVARPVEDVLHDSVDGLSRISEAAPSVVGDAQRFKQVTVDQFLESTGAAFEPD